MKIGYRAPDKLDDVVNVLQQINQKLTRPMAEKLPTVDKRLLNVREASILTGFAVGTLYNLASCKKIPVVRINRKLLFDRIKIEGWISNNSIQARDRNRGYI